MISLSRRLGKLEQLAVRADHPSRIFAVTSEGANYEDVRAVLEAGPHQFNRHQDRIALIRFSSSVASPHSLGVQVTNILPARW